MNLTKALAVVRSDFSFGIKAKLTRQKDDVIEAMIDKAMSNERFVVSLMTRLMENSRVQRIIADQFSGGTPMCRVLSDAVEAAVEDDRKNNIDVDDVTGLEKFIENSFEELARDFEVHADNVKGLDQAIESAIDESEDEIAKIAIAAMAERLGGR